MAYRDLIDIGSENNIGQLVRRLETDYISGVTTSSKYVTFNMAETLNRIDAYLNSRHTSGSTDSLGREKPFFNIVTAAVNIWYRATDIDRKNIRIKATTSKEVTSAFLATIHLWDWMRRDSFGSFLNDWGRALSRYGSSVVKFVEKDGKLHSSVVPWNRLIVDSVDFENNVVIEVMELTEAQLYQREGYDKDLVDRLCDARRSRQTLERTDKDNKNDYIRVYEVHGELPLSFLTDKDKDNDNYIQQMHVISFLASKEGGDTYDDYTLAKGREVKNPYMITHLIKEDGQTLSIGAVQHLFDAQWMMNHTAKSIKDQLDLASKLIFQTSDGNFVGQNALTAIENGDILIHAANQPISQINNNAHDITSLQSFAQQWKALSNEITGISESMLGNAAPSGTAWRQVEALLQQNQSLFELMTENKGLDIEKMLRTYVIPFLKKKMDTKDEVVATLEDHDIKRIDSTYIKNVSTKIVNRRIIDTILKGEVVTAEDQAIMTEMEQNGLKAGLDSLGSQRFFKPSELDDKTWKDVFKDFEWECEVDVTGESSDKDVVTTLTTVLQTIASNPLVLNDPNAKLVFNKILMQVGGISPLELSTAEKTPVSPIQPQQAGLAPSGMAQTA